jgi:hypothetical protein
MYAHRERGLLIISQRHVQVRLKIYKAVGYCRLDSTRSDLLKKLIGMIKIWGKDLAFRLDVNNTVSQNNDVEAQA